MFLPNKEQKNYEELANSRQKNMEINLLNFPTATVINKNIPKTAFYKHAEPKQMARLKEFLTHQMESITWLYKLHPATLNVANGKEVNEIDVFLCKTKTPACNIKRLAEMDLLIPRHTLYIMQHDNAFQLIMQHKTTKSTGTGMQVGQMERLDINTFNPTPLCISGQNMDMVYANFLGRISQLNTTTVPQYQQAAAKRQRYNLLKTQYEALERKMRREKQFPKQMEMNRELRRLKKEMDDNECKN